MPEKKGNLPLALLHKRSGEKLFLINNFQNTFKISKLFSKFIECDHMPLLILSLLILYLKYWSYKEKFDSDLKGSRVTGFHAAMQPCMLTLSFIFCIYLICTWAGLNVPFYKLVHFMCNGISHVHVNTKINITVMMKIKK